MVKSKEPLLTLPTPPMKLMTSQSLPPSSTSSVMIMSHRIDLAGLSSRPQEKFSDFALLSDIKL